MHRTEWLLDVADRWVWFGPFHEVVEDREFLLAMNRESDRENVVHQSRTEEPTRLIARVEERVRARGRGELTWWVHSSTRPQDMAEHLQQSGYVLIETVDILACPLHLAVLDRTTLGRGTAGRPASEGEVFDAVKVLAEVFDSPAPGPNELRQAASEWRESPEGAAGYYVAKNEDGTIVGAAGLTMDGQVAKLWGAGVRSAYRHQGFYRRMVSARLEAARKSGARHALVKARIGTSGPILRRMGFYQLGSETAWRKRFQTGSI